MDRVYIVLPDSEPCPGLTYVAMSRVRRFTDICFKQMKPTRLRDLNITCKGKHLEYWDDRVKELSRVSDRARATAREYTRSAQNRAQEG